MLRCSVYKIKLGGSVSNYLERQAYLPNTQNDSVPLKGRNIFSVLQKYPHYRLSDVGQQV
jgi:hypothetical protein